MFNQLGCYVYFSFNCVAGKFQSFLVYDYYRQEQPVLLLFGLI